MLGPASIDPAARWRCLGPSPKPWALRLFAMALLVGSESCLTRAERISVEHHPTSSAPPPQPRRYEVFETPREAFDQLLRRAPRVIGVGEAHALAGSEDERATVVRFTEELLPALEGRASHLIVELMQPAAGCSLATQAARETAERVTRQQSRDGQSDYVALGRRARQHGIVPFPLRPTCEEYASAAQSGERMAALLSLVAQVTIRMVRQALKGLEEADSKALVIAYGGALHNDLRPDEIRRPWSYGPDLRDATNGRYLALDLIRPEQVRDTAAWRRLPWYDDFRSPDFPSRGAVLLESAPDSYVLFFPARAE